MKRLSGESEEALLQLKNEMTAILENIDNGFISLDKGWRFVYINSKAAKNVRNSGDP
jgi:PAS domain-containing protein